MNKTNNMSTRVFPVPIRAIHHIFPPLAVAIGPGSNPFFHFTRDSSLLRTGQYPARDVFEIRERVFAIRRPEDAFEVFKEFGPLVRQDDGDSFDSELQFSEVLVFRDFFEKALLERSLERADRSLEEAPSRVGRSREELIEELIGHYLAFPIKIDLEFGDPPKGVVHCKDIQESLRVSIFLDKLDGYAWRRCQRKDCGRLFKSMTKREKFYCSTDCAHLQSVRSYNKRKAAGVKSGNEKGRS